MYLTTALRNEEPKFTEVNCDSPRYDYDIPLVKVEAVIEEDVRSIETSKNGFEIDQEESPPKDEIECESDGIPTANEDDVYGEAASNYDSCTDNSVLNAEATAKLAKQIVEKTCKSATNEFMKLIPNYFDMICELCSYGFKSLNEVYRHYREVHKETKATVKCCQRRLPTPCIRDHILHHLNPEVFK